MRMNFAVPSGRIFALPLSVNGTEVSSAGTTVLTSTLPVRMSFPERVCSR